MKRPVNLKGILRDLNKRYVLFHLTSPFVIRRVRTPEISICVRGWIVMEYDYHSMFSHRGEYITESAAPIPHLVPLSPLGVFSSFFCRPFHFREDKRLPPGLGNFFTVFGKCTYVNSVVNSKPTFGSVPGVSSG